MDINNKNRQEDSVVYTIRKAAIRDDTGNYRIRQCHPKTSMKAVQTQSIQADNNKTVGDILNRLKYNNDLRKIVRGE